MKRLVGWVLPTRSWPIGTPNQCQSYPWEAFDILILKTLVGRISMSIWVSAWDFRHPLCLPFIRDISPPMKALSQSVGVTF